MHFNKYSALVSRICHSPGMPVCTGDDLPETDFDFCEPDIRLSEIEEVYLALPQAEVFDDWFNPLSWAARLSQTSHDHNAIRTLTCIGDKPLPSSIRKQISAGRIKTTSKTHTVFITIDDVTDANHVLVQKLKNGKKFRMWYKAGGFMFGGAAGIVATVYGDMVLKRGKGEIMNYELWATWESLKTESRIDIASQVGHCVAPTDISILKISDTIYELHWSGTGPFTFSIQKDGVTIVEAEGHIGNSFELNGFDPSTGYNFIIAKECGTEISEHVAFAFTIDAPELFPIPPYPGLFIGAYYSQWNVVPSSGRVFNWPFAGGAVENALKQPSFFNAPDFIENYFGDKPGIQFRKVSLRNLRTDADFIGLEGLKNYTVFIVMQLGPMGPTAITEVNSIINYATDLSGATNDRGFVFGRGTVVDPTQETLNFKDYADEASGEYSINAVEVSPEDKHVFAITVDRDLPDDEKTKFYLDGVLNSSPSFSGAYSNGMSAGTFNVGRDSGVGAAMTIAAIGFYHDTLDPTQVGVVSTFFADMYGF